MPKENEIKLKVTAAHIDRINARLAELEPDTYAMPRGERFETNVLYDHASLKLKDNDQVLRMRIMKTSKTPHPEYTAELTVKGVAARQAGYSSRDEINVKLEGYAIKQMQDALSMLGFVPTFTYEKKRTSHFLVLHGTDLEIDEVPYLGTFVEIEGKDKAQIDEIVKEFGLDDAEQAKGAYPSLLREALRVRGMPEIVAAFSGAEGIPAHSAEYKGV